MRTDETCQREAEELLRNAQYSNGGIVGEVARLLALMQRLAAERDLAVAHDRQPYPTADAYERVCAALNAAKLRVQELEAARYATRPAIREEATS
mgnify:CR=1 FL=1